MTDPSKIALNLHGKATISQNSFDPTKLISTNKLGISPSNTTLTISYRSNSEIGSSVGSNAVTRVVDSDLLFDSVESLDASEVSFVSNTLEVTNEEPITSVNSSITIEELKQRAIASYASQNRAVSKQDYESLVYNMPAKFGGIKRANIVNEVRDRQYYEKPNQKKHKKNQEIARRKKLNAQRAALAESRRKWFN